MKPILEYKGYLGSAEVSVDDGLIHGKLLYIGDVVSYASESPKQIEQAFREAVDDYLETCAELGDAPDVPFKGVFNVRLGPELHRACALSAESSGVKLNEWVKDACQAKLDRKAERSHPQHLMKILLESTNSHLLASHDDFSMPMEFGKWAKADPVTMQ